MSKPRVEPDFCFAFADGIKWQDDMTRDELLIVIQTLLLEREYERRDARDALELARLRANRR